MDRCRGLGPHNIHRPHERGDCVLKRVDDEIQNEAYDLTIEQQVNLFEVIYERTGFQP